MSQQITQAGGLFLLFFMKFPSRRQSASLCIDSMAPVVSLQLHAVRVCELDGAKVVDKAAHNSGVASRSSPPAPPLTAGLQHNKLNRNMSAKVLTHPARLKVEGLSLGNWTRSSILKWFTSHPRRLLQFQN